MSDSMQLLSLRRLFERIAEEYRSARTVFGIEERRWFRPATERSVVINGESCEMPLGPAAGPHTQLAQNIVSAYLTGSRFFELKTVQILDSLEIEKPCIDATDEGYNVEWSTELSLDDAWREYARAWIVVHALDEVLRLRDATATGPHPNHGAIDASLARHDGGSSAAHGSVAADSGSAPETTGAAASSVTSPPATALTAPPPHGVPRFIFNMSVGYNLEGIRKPPMQRYLDRMADPASEPEFVSWLDELSELLPRLAEAFGVSLPADSAQRVRAAADTSICTSVTLSTMHGCPPDEIESICRYLLTERGLDTFVKLNPTLLGYDRVRSILDDLGYTSVELNRTGFEHDLQYTDARAILARLRDVAAVNGRAFGVKLTNTLAVRNTRSVLPGEEMYLSGRALYPIAITLAAQVAREFDGALPISYCGGVSIHNAASILSTGIRPLTLCTSLLKPGGYARQTQIAQALEGVQEWSRARIDVETLESLAGEVRRDVTAHKSFRGTDEVRVRGTLPSTDCYRAPCVEACPIHQHIPEYIRLVGEGRYAEALRLIYERNALPSITGHICDHQCQHACTRLDYEGCLNIRDLKKVAVEEGRSDYLAGWKPPEATRSERCAVIGAGPAGLAAAYFLARSGFAVTIFEREANVGGVVRNVIPGFRLPVEAIEDDVAFIREHGVEFVFGTTPERTKLDALRAAGFGPIVVAVGAEAGTELPLQGDATKVVRSLDFLRAFRSGDDAPLGAGRTMRNPGKDVVVVGGGNTAMDAARAAKTLPGVERVSVLYRRTEAEMPADREEYENAIADGVTFHFLRNPEAAAADGTLTVREMELGEPDASGRRRPVATDRTLSMRADIILSAIGERADSDVLRAIGVPSGPDGAVALDRATLETTMRGVYLAGDAQSGPSTVVQCIAAGRRVADAIAARSDNEAGAPGTTAAADRARERSATPAIELRDRLAQLGARKTRVVDPVPLKLSGTALAKREYERCLECSYVCNKCVEVCPNRANITVPTMGEALFNDPFQIVHVDAYCNECGNCAHFCPWEEKVPYRDKPTVFSSRAAFDASTNDGWLVEGATVRVRYNGRVTGPRLVDGRLEGFGAPDAVSADASDVSRFARLFEIVYRERPALFEVMS